MSIKEFTSTLCTPTPGFLIWIVKSSMSLTTLFANPEEPSKGQTLPNKVYRLLYIGLQSIIDKSEGL